MLRFKSYLAEQELLAEGTTSASTLFEGVIVDCWNLASTYDMRKPWNKFDKQKEFKDEIFRGNPETNISKFLDKADERPEWATTGKTEEKRAELFWHFARLCRRKIKVSGNAVGSGTSKLKLSTFWSSTPNVESPDYLGGTGKKHDTSKADIIIGKTGISVKAPSANIMSGKKNEGKATIVTAMTASGGDVDLKNKLLKHLDGFATDVNTIGPKMTGTLLKSPKYSPDAVKKMKKADRDAFKKKVNDEEGTSNEEIRALLIEKEGVFKDQVEADFKIAFKTPAVRTAFAFEAMTGDEKFSGAVMKIGAGAKKGTATHMLIWDYDMKKLRYYSVKEKVNDVAEQLKMAASLKSSRRKKEGKKVGYSIYQSMRLAINTAMDKADGLVRKRNEQIELAGNLLEEGMIDEFAFLDSLKKAWNWFKEKMAAVWDWIKEQWNKIKEKLLEVWEDGVGAVMSHFETDIKVTVNTNVKL